MKKTIGLVASELYVMYSYDSEIHQQVLYSNHPTRELIRIGLDRGVHDLNELDTRREGLTYLIDLLLGSTLTCNGE